ncbi:MAG: hypothetical protein R3F48_02160 [Candidatus Zixiibacteriota bacterium]
MRKYKILLPILIMLFILTAPIGAWQVNQHYKNTTAETAYDMTKVLLGPNITFTQVMLGQPFPDFTQYSLGGVTLGHWYSVGNTATVIPGEYGHACFSTDFYKPPPFAAFWTRADHSIIGRAGPVMDFDIKFVGHRLLIKMKNQWQVWTGTAIPPGTGDRLEGHVGPITVGEIKYAVDSFATTFSLEELDSTLIGPYNFIDVPGMTGVFDTTEERTASVIDSTIQAGHTVLLYFTLTGPGGEESYYMIACEAKITPMPATTTWGIIALLLLLALTAGYLFMRRRPKFSL